MAEISQVANKVVIKVAIIDDNIELTKLTSQYLTDLGRYEIVGTARDGAHGLALLQTQEVDVALIDLVLPDKDGFYVLEEIAKTPDIKPACIIFSGVGLEFITRKAFEKGADFFILKPFDLALLARRIDEVWEQKHSRAQSKTPTEKTLDNYSESRPESRLENRLESRFENRSEIRSLNPRQKNTKPENFILDVLHDIPIANTLIGYTYLKVAIQLAIENGELLESVTKRLYPAVAKRNNTTGPQVERAIRHALDIAWRKGGGRHFVQIVGYGNPAAPKPTNSAFITALVELYHQVYG